MDMIAVQNGTYLREGFRLAMDFALPRGSVTAVLGPSGAGKSTLLNIIAGFDDLASGQVLLGGENHTKTLPSKRPVNFVFQDNNSFAHLSARENVGIGVSPNLKLSAEQWMQVDEALAHVGLSALAIKRPGEMSGGERQRIALARVLVRRQPILLLDEAFAALGPALRNEMLLLVKRIQTERELTVVMVTHQPEDAKLIADHVLYVDCGAVRQQKTTDAFFKSTDVDVLRHLQPADSGFRRNDVT